MDADPLDTGLLEALNRRWRQDSSLIAALQPGLSGQEMDELTAPLGLRVPSEARTLWSWHNGTSPIKRIGAAWALFSVEKAVQAALEARDRATQVAGDKAEPMLWRWKWLPIAGSNHGGVLCVDGEADPNEMLSPLYYSEPQFGAEDDTPRSRSLREAVTWWIDAFDTGAYHWDADRATWIYDFELLDEERERTRVI